jgi:O-antigen ligase
MLNYILTFLAVFGVYLGITAVCEHYGVTTLVFPKYILDPAVGIQFGRSRGPFGDTIGNGGMLLLAFMVLACVTSFLTGPKRVLTFGLTLCVVVGIYFTETRAVWLGLAALMATLMSLRTSMRRTSAAVASIVFVGFLAGAGSKFSVFETTLFGARQDTVEYRLNNFQTAWSAFKINPMFGVGYGRFREVAKRFAEDGASGRGLEDGNHSTALGILAELGITGFGLFVAILVCSGIVCLAAHRRLKDERWELERNFALIGLGVLEVFFILGLTNDLNAVAPVNMATFWFIGTASALESSYNESKSGPNRWGKSELPMGAYAARSQPRYVRNDGAVLETVARG